MIIKLITRMAGADGNFAPDSEISVNAIRGEELIKGKYAVLVQADPKMPDIPVEEVVNYDFSTRADLMAILDEKQIDYSKRATKAELIELIGGTHVK